MFSSISADGRFVAFQSSASNLVSGDANGTYDIFLRDMQTDTTTCISVDPSGNPGNSDSYSLHSPSISADGRYVAFESHASNLVSGDLNGAEDIFLRDTQAGTTTLVSVNSDGNQGLSWSEAPSISADGRYVAFASYASNLVSGDGNHAPDIFRHDMQTGTTIRISVDSNGVEGNDSSGSTSISADGRYVAFVSLANNLVDGDTNLMTDVFLRDTQTETTERVSVNSSGEQGNENSSWELSISADGRYVAFASFASNLVSGDTNGAHDIFLRDTQTDITTRVSLSSSGVQGDFGSDLPSISADGRYVAFTSTANNLVSGDAGWTYDVFLRDTQTGTTLRLSLNSSGTQGNGASQRPSISANGRIVAFDSLATNLVSGDANGKFDVFVTPVPTISRLYLPLVIR